jgi:hypothetical protein
MTTGVGEEFVPLSLFADRPLTLTPEDYPNKSWGARTGSYNEWWAYYQGYKLQERAGKRPEDPLVYPFRLNIIRPAVILHAAALVGQIKEEIVQFGIGTKYGTDKEAAKIIGHDLNMLWNINDGDSHFLEAAIFQQVFGGFYIQAQFHPNRAKWPIRYVVHDPRDVFPVWDGYDYNRLVSVDIMTQIPKPLALARYGIQSFNSVREEWVSLHEHWDEREYFIEIDGRLALWPDGSEMRGPNPWQDPVMGYNVIPVVYTPRIRAGSFYGDSLIPSLIGPQQEINSNIAHLGDGLADAMHQQPWIRNASKGLQNIKTASRQEWINLGMTQYGQHAPEAGRLDGAEISQAMIDFVMDDLVAAAREHINLPDVAWGKIDASIRSALTLSFMLKPYNDIAAHYRTHAKIGLKWLNYTALIIALNKQKFGNVFSHPITTDHLEAVILSHRTTLAPVLPQDRIDLVNEIVQRLSAHAMSIETAVRRLDGDEELEEEMERIKGEVEEEQKRVVEQGEAQMRARQAGMNSGGTSNRTKADGGRKSE